jgi:hypothetical protein
MHLAALAKNNSKFGAVDSLITSNGALSFIEEKKIEGGEKKKFPGKLSSAHRIHNKVGPTVRGTNHVSQVHTYFPFDLNFCLDLRTDLVYHCLYRTYTHNGLISFLFRLN